MGSPRYEISPDHKPATCSKCGAEIFWVKTKNNKNMPCNADGYSHFETCPDAKDFSGQSRKAEATAKGELNDEMGKVLDMFDDHVKKTDERHQKMRGWTSTVEKRLAEIDKRFTKMSEWATKMEARVKELEGKQ